MLNETDKDSKVSSCCLLALCSRFCMIQQTEKPLQFQNLTINGGTNGKSPSQPLKFLLPLRPQPQYGHSYLVPNQISNPKCRHWDLHRLVIWQAWAWILVLPFKNQTSSYTLSWISRFATVPNFQGSLSKSLCWGPSTCCSGRMAVAIWTSIQCWWKMGKLGQCEPFRTLSYSGHKKEAA